jgi:hypothetical protein
MTRHFRIERQDDGLQTLSGEELLLMAVLGGARTRRQIHQELGRRTLGTPGASRSRRVARQSMRLRLAA